MRRAARGLGCVALGCAAGWVAARLMSPGQHPAPVEMTSWQQLAWQARFDEILHGPEGDVEEAFLVMVTGWFRDDPGSAE